MSFRKTKYFLLLTLLFLSPLKAMEEDPNIWVKKHRKLKIDAKAGNVEAQYELGVLYTHGGGGVLVKQPNKAIHWLEEASRKGHTEATIDLICLYLNYGTISYKTQEEADQVAFKLTKKLIKRNHTVAKKILGWMYLQNRGRERNITEGLEWYHRAIDAGDTSALYALGQFYENGIHMNRHFGKKIVYLEIDKDQAIELYKIAAQKDYEDAQIRLQELGISYKRNIKDLRNEIKIAEEKIQQLNVEIKQAEEEIKKIQSAKIFPQLHTSFTAQAQERKQRPAKKSIPQTNEEQPAPQKLENQEKEQPTKKRPPQVKRQTPNSQKPEDKKDSLDS